MSIVTDIILTVSLCEQDRENCVPLTVTAFDDRLVSVDHLGGGNKAMQCNIFIGAINCLDRGAYVLRFRRTPWLDPDSVQLFLKGEYDDRFELITY